MARFYTEPCHTFNEYLLIPGLTTCECTMGNVSVRSGLCRHKSGEASPIHLNVPLVSAIMQSVSGERMAIAFAGEGGLSFIYSSQTVEQQCAVVRAVKNYKAGFVLSDSNVRPDQTFGDILAVSARTGHTTVAVAIDGSASGELLGIVTRRDYPFDQGDTATPASAIMTRLADLRVGRETVRLSEANEMI